MTSEVDKSVYGYERASFKGFGSYGDHNIEDRVNQLMKIGKDEYPMMDNYLLWLCITDYVIKDELKIETNDEKAKEFYENFMKERNKFTYNSVVLQDEEGNEIKENTEILNREISDIKISND